DGSGGRILSFRRRGLLKAVSAAALAAVLVPAAAAARTPSDDGSRIIFDSRLRSGSVDQAGAAREGHALTLRTRLDWRSPTVVELQLLIEGEGERTGFPDASTTGAERASPGSRITAGRCPGRRAGSA